MREETRKKALLLGVGFDAKDGHKRLTKGPNFYLVGGSKETHGFMQEKAIEFNEELKKRRKTLEEVTKSEFLEIAEEIRLNDPH